MELALSLKRSISFAVAVFLLAAISGCTDKPADKPVPKSGEKKVTSSSHGERNGELASLSNPGSGFEVPNDSVKTNVKDVEKPKPEKKGDRDAQEKPSDVKDKVPESKEEKKDKEKPAADTDNKKLDTKEAEEKEEKEETEGKRMTDEEIAASNAERKKAAFKAIIDKLGPPLVENIDKLTKIHPLFPVWVDKQNKQVILEGVICQTGAPLEMFAVPTGTKEHEAIVATPTEAYVVHAALIAVGAKPGKPVEFGPEPKDYKPATGTPIEISVKWKNDKGEIKSAKAQEWIKNVKTGKDMQETWVFGGSGFWKDEQTGIEYYKAEGGDFICVSNFPSAMLDLPIESSQSNDDLMFQANPDRIPPRGTPVTLILKPKLPAQTDKSAPGATPVPEKNEDLKPNSQKGEEKSPAKQSEAKK